MYLDSSTYSNSDERNGFWNVEFDWNSGRVQCLLAIDQRRQRTSAQGGGGYG